MSIFIVNYMEIIEMKSSLRLSKNVPIKVKGVGYEYVIFT